jgi:hypothetical protein
MENNTEQKPEITIPENIQDICREFAEVARKHQLRKFSVKFEPSFDQEWGGEVTAFWEWGRHGDDMNHLRIASSFSVNTQVTVKTKTNG